MGAKVVVIVVIVVVVVIVTISNSNGNFFIKRYVTCNNLTIGKC